MNCAFFSGFLSGFDLPPGKAQQQLCRPLLSLYHCHSLLPFPRNQIEQSLLILASTTRPSVGREKENWCLCISWTPRRPRRQDAANAAAASEMADVVAERTAH